MSRTFALIVVEGALEVPASLRLHPWSQLNPWGEALIDTPPIQTRPRMSPIT